jgi:Histidine kinase-, DNA gyrase B-, and HSP90-like ATPase
LSQEFQLVQKNGKTYAHVPPSPSRTVRALGHLSYDFPKALADLIDNSIAANATAVDVVIEQRIGGKVYVHVMDNGDGILEAKLPAAIQYGAEDRRDEKSLGVYGFGLKTACQSFTNKFLLVSKAKNESETNMIVFDEAVVDQENDFLFEVDAAPRKFVTLLEQFAPHGTIVATENANRFFTSEKGQQDDKKAKKYIDNRINTTRDQLRKTFQRFLDFSDKRAPNVEIHLNGQSLTPWDPFCLKEEGVAPEAEQKFSDLRTKSGKVGSVVMRGYILPSKVEFKNRELYEDAQIGPSTHGVYVYRENRLILAATYFDLFNHETHLSNLRVEFSYDGALDELFLTSLQKGGMTLSDLEEAVRDFLRPLVREADARSRGAQKKKDTKDFHSLSQKRIAAAENRIPHANVSAIDGKTASVQSKYGSVILPIESVNDEKEALPINPVESIDDGQLWQMRLHNGQQVVELNKGHDFYAKVYFPNKGNSIAIQGLDMVFWSLAITEANCTIPEYQRQFREFRYEVSRTLREIVESLPEPKLDEDDF